MFLCISYLINDNCIFHNTLSPTFLQVNYEIMRRSMVLRAALVPYIYTHAREAYDEGLSLLRPMYYEFPEEDNAYMFDKQVG